MGTIVCKASLSKDETKMRGYIAMLAVDSKYRKRGIGTGLVRKALIRMRDEFECDEVFLEAEITNKGALALYARLGFVREKRMERYYMNGNDAFNLLLWFPKRDKTKKEDEKKEDNMSKGTEDTASTPTVESETKEEGKTES